ncbi:uncharacterized protein LOC114489711 [Phyllostomus discolor]|uniref:Uncharacterized protein LOC114489711 n=1 Tax=Phyllostomus discolor TaxID=89673 RepID=A0A7E6CRR3_9CHIR|nr:uncharacterized protein LOC114489711 [Phyllostomus discolor]
MPEQLLHHQHPEPAEVLRVPHRLPEVLVLAEAHGLPVLRPQGVPQQLLRHQQPQPAPLLHAPHHLLSVPVLAQAQPGLLLGAQRVPQPVLPQSDRDCARALQAPHRIPGPVPATGECWAGPAAWAGWTRRQKGSVRFQRSPPAWCHQHAERVKLRPSEPEGPTDVLDQAT